MERVTIVAALASERLSARASGHVEHAIDWNETFRQQDRAPTNPARR
jgi:hypothetical protein